MPIVFDLARAVPRNRCRADSVIASGIAADDPAFGAGGCAGAKLVTMPEAVEIVAYDPAWPHLFGAIAQNLRRELVDLALRIDHIGSTAVPGLVAKAVIDIQVSVRSFEPLDDLVARMDQAGFVFRPGAELTKRYFRERPGDRRTHIHIRRAGSFSEQFALLFRDYLRAHPERAAHYGQLKHDLAAQFGVPERRHEYVMAKVPFIWDTVRLADEWAGEVGWEPGPTDG